MMRRIPVLAILVFAAASAAASGAGVAGRWALSVESPHGTVAMDLLLKQEGKTVRGTISGAQAADVPLQGEFAEGALTFRTAAAGNQEALEFRGRLQEDGTLSGYFSTSIGDMKCTGKRAAAGKK